MVSAEERSIPVLLLTFLSCTFPVHSEICYRCVDEFIVVHWGHFLPVQAEHDLVADSSCIKTNERTEEIRCLGSCLTLNVTIGEGNRIRTIGMMRDCQKKYYRRDLNKDGENHRCQNQTVKFRQHILKAEYCFCLGNYCNGDHKRLNSSVSEFRKTMKHLKIGSNQSNDTTTGRSLYCAQYLMLIYLIYLKLHLINL